MGVCVNLQGDDIVEILKGHVRLAPLTKVEFAMVYEVLRVKKKDLRALCVSETKRELRERG